MFYNVCMTKFQFQIDAYWGKVEALLVINGYSSLRQLCEKNKLNYQVIAAARRRHVFPSLENALEISEILHCNLLEMIYSDDSAADTERGSKFLDNFEFDEIKVIAIKPLNRVATESLAKALSRRK